MIVFKFYVPALNRYIYLDLEEIKPFIQRAKYEIGITKFYKLATRILYEVGVPKGYLRSTALQIAQALREGDYEILMTPEEILTPEERFEEEKAMEEIRGLPEGEIETKMRYYKVRLMWHARTDYCEKSGHHLVVEAYVTFDYTIPAECFDSHMKEIEDYADDKLFFGFTEFLDKYYVNVYTDYDSGISDHFILDTFEADVGTPIRYEIITADIYVGRSCGHAPEYRDDLSDEFEDFIGGYIADIVGFIGGLCGVEVE